MIDRVAIIGAGNGGKAAAADLTLQGKRVHLFEFSEFKINLEEVLREKALTATGVVSGRATLDRITCDLTEALDGADTVMVCTQALAHDRAARELAPLILPDQLVILNPGSTCGSLHFARVFREMGLKRLPTFVETSTLTYACRAKGAKVDILVRVARVLYSTLPAVALDRIGPELEGIYSGLVRAASVLEVGLNNGNPVIHPAITLLNAARIEKEGNKMFFYRDGVSPAVARLIQKVDEERMALLKALGYPAQSEPVTSVQQGYASSTDYFECYGKGLGYRDLPSPDSLDNRYLHEDIGMSLVMFCSLGKLLGVPTPTCELIVRLGENLTGMDYFAKGVRTVEALGLAGMQLDQIKSYLETGGMPCVC
jgi:opine dehydrogenase